MTREDRFTRVERRLINLRSGGGLDRADVEALLEADDPVDRQAGLRGLVLIASEEDGCFEEGVPSLTPFLEDPNPDIRYNALQALIELLPARPELVADTPAVVDLLDDSDRVAEKALDAVSAVAEQDARAVGGAAVDVAAALEADRSEIRKRAVRFFTVLVQESPGDAIPAVDSLVALVGDTYEMPVLDGDDWQTPLAHRQTRRDVVSHGHEERERHMAIREFAAEVLIAVTRERPEAIRSRSDVLRGYLAHDDPHVRRQALRVFTALGDQRPDAVVAIDDEILACVDDGASDELAAAAVKPLGIAASEAPDRVVPDLIERVDRLVALLDHDDPHVRGTAAGLLSHVADRDPAAVEPAGGAMIDLLDDPRAFVRGNAVWALGSLGTDEAIAALRERCETESEPAVRSAIDRVLDTQESTDG